jgi:hypothetical protein
MMRASIPEGDVMSEDGGTPPVPAPPSAGPSQTPPPGARERYRVPVVAWAALAALAAIAIAIPLLSGGSLVLLEDDFSRSSSLNRWTEATDPSGSMGYVDGAYRIETSTQGEIQSYADIGDQRSIRVDVDATMLAGTGGLSVLCVSQTDLSAVGAIDEISGDDRYYDFFVSFVQGGGYAIFRSDRLQEPLTFSPDTDVLRAGTNHVRAECRGASGSEPARVSMWINDTQVLTYADPQGYASFVAVGLSVYSDEGSAEAMFDNVSVSKV